MSAAPCGVWSAGQAVRCSCHMTHQMCYTHSTVTVTVTFTGVTVILSVTLTINMFLQYYRYSDHQSCVIVTISVD